MAVPPDALEELKRRLGDEPVENGERIQGELWVSGAWDLSELDGEFAHAWAEWIYGHMYVRGVIEEPTRLLTVVGMCAALGHDHMIPIHVKAALNAGVDVRAILEVILQSSIYAGMPPMVKCLARYRSTLEELGLAWWEPREWGVPGLMSDARGATA